MRRTYILTLLLAISTVANAEEISLFNGKDLSGWTGDKQLWSVEDGTIVGTTKGLTYNTFLISDGDYDNFELRFKAKLDNNNSGVQFRSKIVDPAKFVMAGYQADIAPNYWGLLYEEKLRGMIDFTRAKEVANVAKVGEWADYVVRANGPEIVITVNGKETVHYMEKNAAVGAKTGKIGLQLHAGPAMKVQFKDIVLKPLAK
ncbi:MAG: DUF1080 domain-containing protein [Planctomycetota bacterium]